MYLRSSFEEELNRPVVSFDPMRDAARWELEKHRDAEGYARWAAWCQIRHAERMIAREGLVNTVKYVMEAKTLPGIFENTYSVKADHVNLAVSMVRMSIMALVKSVLEVKAKEAN